MKNMFLNTMRAVMLIMSCISVDNDDNIIFCIHSSENIVVAVVAAIIIIIIDDCKLLFDYKFQLLVVFSPQYPPRDRRKRV